MNPDRSCSCPGRRARLLRLCGRHRQGGRGCGRHLPHVLPTRTHTCPLCPRSIPSWTASNASGGSIAIELVNQWRGAPGSGKGTIDDVANGVVDLAWVGTRAFDLTGETALQALTAPLLVDSNELAQAIIDTDLPARMVEAVHIDGLETLAILAGGLRRPLSVDGPLASAPPASWRRTASLAWGETRWSIRRPAPSTPCRTLVPQ